MKLAVFLGLVAAAVAVYIEPQGAPRHPGDPVGCNELEDGDYALPDNDGCNHGYVSCIGYGYFEVRDCGHLYFDQYSRSCQHEHYVYACGGVHTVPEEPEPTTHNTAVACQGIYPGTKLLAKGDEDECLPNYFECELGRQYATPRDCAPGAFFDVLFMDCADYYEVYACSGGYRHPDVTTPDPEPVIKQYIDYECPYPGVFKHPNYECSPFSVVCDGYNPAFLEECQGYGNFYDYEVNRCGSYYEVPACSGKARPEVNPSTPRPPIDVNFRCSEVYDGNYAYPTEDPCPTQYVSCVRHHVDDLTTCPYGTYYHSDALRQGRCLAYCPGTEPHTSTRRPAVSVYHPSSYPEPEPTPEPVYPAPVYPAPQPEPVYPAPQPEPVYPAPNPEPVYSGRK